MRLPLPVVPSVSSSPVSRSPAAADPSKGWGSSCYPDVVAERARFELANRVTPGYGISTADSLKRIFLRLLAPQLQFDLNLTSALS